MVIISLRVYENINKTNGIMQIPQFHKNLQIRKHNIYDDINESSVWQDLANRLIDTLI